MQRHILLVAAILAVSAGPVSAQTRRASIRGGDPNRGKCTIEVVVDGAADVEVRGDTATLRNLSGRPPQWRRFECTASMPFNPAEFRFKGIDGRGRQELIRHPGNGGVAVVRIEDPDGGAEGYTFDLLWSGSLGYGVPERGEREFGRRFTTEEAVRGCQEAVREQVAARLRTRDIAFRRTVLDDNPGRRDWVVGAFDVRRYGREEVYRFSCSVDFDSGRVRSAEFEPAERDDDRPGYRDDAARTGQAIESCQRAVEQRVYRDGFERVDVRSINVDNRPGRNDWIVGNARAEGRRGSRPLEFSCSVNLEDGVVRSLDVRYR